MRILVVSSTYPPYHGGGYGLLCQWHAEALAQRGHEVSVLTAVPASQAEGEPASAAIGVTRRLRPIPHGSSPGKLFVETLHNRRIVRTAIRSTRPDVVYCHGIDGVGFEVYHTAVGSDLPSLTAVGDTWLAQAWRDLSRFDPWCAVANGGRRTGLRRMLKTAVGAVGKGVGLFVGSRPSRFCPVVTISRFLADDLLASGVPCGDEIQVVPTPVHRSFFLGGKPVGHSGVRTEVLRALFVGRMELLKGPDTAIRGLAAAIQAGARVTLTLAGLQISRTKEELTRLAEELQVTEYITWAGTPTAEALREIYRHHDAFLFPSRIVEGYGMVNGEAMACGLPVIGTADSGSADAIIDGVTGFRIAAGDSQALGRHLVALHHDRDLLNRLSASATKHAQRHEPAHVTDQIEHRLQRIAAKWSHQGGIA